MNIPDQKTLIKYGTLAVIAITIIVAAIFAWKYVKGMLKDTITERQQEHINALEIDEQEISLPKTEMQNLVSKLKTAFGKWGYATDEEQVYAVFEALDTRSDLLSLINAFGVYKEHTLGEWMTKELNDSELEHVQNILSTKGIIYSF